MTHTFPIHSTAHSELFDYEEPSDVMATAVDQLDADTATEVDQSAGDRARGIAAIHAYAQWLADNPDVPMPTHVTGSSHPDNVRSGYAERAALVRVFAAAYDGSKQRGGRSAWSTVVVKRAPGIMIDHTVFACEQPTPDADAWL